MSELLLGRGSIASVSDCDLDLVTSENIGDWLLATCGSMTSCLGSNVFDSVIFNSLISELSKNLRSISALVSEGLGTSTVKGISGVSTGIGSSGLMCSLTAGRENEVINGFGGSILSFNGKTFGIAGSSLGFSSIGASFL